MRHDRTGVESYSNRHVGLRPTGVDEVEDVAAGSLRCRDRHAAACRVDCDEDELAIERRLKWRRGTAYLNYPLLSGIEINLVGRDGQDSR